MRVCRVCVEVKGHYQVSSTAFPFHYWDRITHWPQRTSVQSLATELRNPLPPTLWWSVRFRHVPCATITSLNRNGNQTHGFMHAWPTLSQLSSMHILTLLLGWAWLLLRLYTWLYFQVVMWHFLMHSTRTYNTRVSLSSQLLPYFCFYIYFKPPQ